MREKHSFSEIVAQVETNSRIFKENLKVIASLLVEAVWRESVAPEALVPSIKRALNDYFKGSIEEIKETEEENLSLSIDPPADPAAPPRSYRVPALRIPSSASSAREDSQNDLMCTDSGLPTPLALSDFAFPAETLPPPKKTRLGQAPHTFLAPPRPPSQTEVGSLASESSFRRDPANPRLRCFLDAIGSASPHRMARRRDACGIGGAAKKDFAERAFRTGFRFEPARGSPGREKGLKSACSSPASAKSSPAPRCFLRELNKENSLPVQPGAFSPKLAGAPRAPPADLLRFPTSQAFRRAQQ